MGALHLEHAVIIHLPLHEDDFGSERERAAVAVLINNLEQIVHETQVGEFDGEELGDGRCVLYLYGPDADILFQVVEPLLKDTPLARGGFAIKRYGYAGDPDAVERRIPLR